MRSGSYGDAKPVTLLGSSGARIFGLTNTRYAVRPASSNAVNFKKAADARAFGSVARMYDAWLRSGFNGNAYYAYLLNSNGGSVYRNTGNRAAVRPALHLFAEKFIADNSRIRLV